MEFERYWLFAVLCALVVGFVLRLVLRETVTLQHSLAFLGLMSLILLSALLPSYTTRLSTFLGFVLPSNFFFAVLIGALVLLHLGTLIALSRLEARTIALIQDLGLLHERLARAEKAPTAAASTEDRADARHSSS
jgi:hypothetical protein